MSSFLFKWLVLSFSLLNISADKAHPVYVSVTEIEHNAKEKTLEISCKIFTDDFEKALRSANKGTRVDLFDTKQKAAMDKLVNTYVQQHLKISVNGLPATLKYLGYEIIEEGVYSYYEAGNIATVKKIEVKDNILYEYKAEQLSLIHVIVNGDRQSTKLNNPEEKAGFAF